jgi:hypothetical protein
MQPSGESPLTMEDAADYSAALLENLADITKQAGLVQSAELIQLAIDMIRMESTTPAAKRQFART